METFHGSLKVYHHQFWYTFGTLFLHIRNFWYSFWTLFVDLLALFLFLRLFFQGQKRLKQIQNVSNRNRKEV